MLPQGFSFPAPPPPPVVHANSSLNGFMLQPSPPANGQWNNSYQHERGGGHVPYGSRGGRGDMRGRGRGRGRTHDGGRGGRGSFHSGQRGNMMPNNGYRKDSAQGPHNQQPNYQNQYQPQTAPRYTPQTQPASLYPSAPAVPSFGLPIPSFAPTTPVVSPSISAQKTSSPNKRLKLNPSTTSTPNLKRKHNLLGLTPRDSSDPPSDDDAPDEEAAYTSNSPLNSSLLQIEYKGVTSTLRSAEDIEAWISERKKRWPTRARVEEKVREDGKRKVELAEARKKVLESQREVAAKRRANIVERAERERDREGKRAEAEGDGEDTSKAKKQKGNAARRQRKRNRKGKGEAAFPTPKSEGGTPGALDASLKGEQKEDPPAESSLPQANETASSVKDISAPSKPEITSPPPTIDPLLAARRARIEALRKQLAEEEAEMMHASQPAHVEPQANTPLKTDTRQEPVTSGERLDTVKKEEDEELRPPSSTPQSARPSPEPQTPVHASSDLKEEEEDTSHHANSTSTSPKPITNTDPIKADSAIDIDSDSSSSSLLSSSSSSSSSLSTSSANSGPIKRRTPYNPPENPTAPVASKSSPPQTRRQCHHYARTGRCRYRFSTCTYAHGADDGNPSGGGGVDRSVNSFAGASVAGNGAGGGGRERGKMERRAARKTLHAVMVEKEREREDEVVLGVLKRLGEGAALQ